MLIEKKYSQGDILAVKMITGEEIICKLQEITSIGMIISKPFTMILVPGEKSQGSVVFAPFMLGVDDKAYLTLGNDKIITYTKANVESSAQYMKAIAGMETAHETIAKIFN